MGRMRPKMASKRTRRNTGGLDFGETVTPGTPFSLSGESDRDGSSPARARKEVRNGAHHNKFNEIV